MLGSAAFPGGGVLVSVTGSCRGALHISHHFSPESLGDAFAMLAPAHKLDQPLAVVFEKAVRLLLRRCRETAEQMQAEEITTS